VPDFDLTRLKGRKLFVGTPMYDGKCHSEFAIAFARLTALCTQLGINLNFHFACHEALVAKARNITVDEFLRSGDDNLIFIDADIGFDPRDVLHLLALQSLDDGAGPFDVVAAPYPLKRIAWEKILAAAKAGLVDDDPARLARYSSGVSIHPAHDGRFPVNAPVEVTQAGTGFMMIRRETFERYRARFPARRYRTEFDVAGEARSAEIQAYFETETDSKQANIVSEIRAFLERAPQSTPSDLLDFIDSDATARAYSGHHVSEDYAFCRRVREIGMAVWLCPWMALTHTGSHQFASRLADLGAIGAV
jgi:hypothetical protein